jgi:hypothetical protein
MDWDLVKASSFMMVLNLIYALVALFVGVLAVRLVDWVILRKIDLQDEIKRGNVAGAIFAAALLIFVAVIIGMAMSK